MLAKMARKEKDLVHRWWKWKLGQPLWKKLEILPENTNETTTLSSNFTSGHLFKENKNKKLLKISVAPHLLQLYIRQDREATKVSIYGWIDKLWLICISIYISTSMCMWQYSIFSYKRKEYYLAICNYMTDFEGIVLSE